MLVRWLMIFVAWCPVDPVDADEAAAIGVLRAAYEQHFAACSSGKMKFTYRTERSDSGQELFLDGEVEWDDDYLYFSGEFKQALATTRGLVVSHHRVKVLDSSGFELKVLVNPNPPTESNSCTAYTANYELAVDKSTLPKSARPDPVKYLTTAEILGMYGTPLSVLGPGLVTPDNVKIERTLESLTETTAVLKILYPGPQETWLTFDLTKEGLCSHYKSFWPRDGDVYLSGTRTWSQNSVGAWYPSESQAAYRRGSESAKPHFTGELLIHSFEPLSKRAFTGRATLTSFGPVPKGAFVSESLGEGRFREWIEGETGKNDVESELKRLADRIKSNSFMDDGKGSTK